MDKDEIKNNGHVLLSTVQTALKKRELVAKGERERVHPELLKHYKSDRKWSNASQGLHYITSLAFVVLMIHASLSVGAKLIPLLFATIAILAGEITNIVVSQRDGSIARRADKNHDEILQAARFAILFDACSSISELEERDKARSDLIQTAATNWLTPEAQTGKLTSGSKAPTK